MSQATQSKKLAWKEFNINLQAIDTWMKANVGDHYCGNSAAGELTLWFTDVLTADQDAAIDLYWEALHAEASEATSYQSAAQLAASIAAKAASGKAKLIALGLTEDEANALLK
jgi:hypothetical protein